ncbi:TPA: hypothetical protein HA372_01880 [Candidatus Woesearchaeota archaeon]|nr:hypothetical protein [Candidatus Woesearchaeota archaeon]
MVHTGIRPQLLEDMNGGRVSYRKLADSQKTAVQAITRPQLRMDVYEGMTGLSYIVQRITEIK